METVFRGMLLGALATVAACGGGAADAQAATAAESETSNGTGPAELRDKLGGPNGFTIAAGDIELRLTARGCETFVEGLLVCANDVRVDVLMPLQQLRQSLHPPATMLKSDSLVYRGPLEADDRPDPHSFVISDVNADGREDLIIWVGREGAYGGPSFQVYLYDESARQLRLSEPFSDLTVGYIGLFGVTGRSITTNASSGCCLHIEETYVVEADVPQLVQRVTTEDSSHGEPKVTTERLVDGRLRPVDSR